MPNYKYKIPPEYVGASGDITIAGLMKLLQSAASEHSDELGYSAHWLRKNQVGWVARTHRINHTETLDPEQPVMIFTGIEDCRRVRSLRHYEVRQQKSEQILASGYSDWVFVDRSDGTIKRIPEDMKEAFEPTYEDTSLNRQSVTVPELPNTYYSNSYTVQFRDLDGQIHVNNATYFDYFLDLFVRWRLDRYEQNTLSPEYNFWIKEFNVHYQHPARWPLTIEGLIFSTNTTREIEEAGFQFRCDDELIIGGTAEFSDVFS